eukprot:275070_1
MLRSKWQLECYPNGKLTESTDYISLFLRCNSLPDKYSLSINFQFNFVEVKRVWDCERLYFKDRCSGIAKALKRDPNLSKLTIKVKMENTAFMRDGWMIWKIKGYLLDEFKSCEVKKDYNSPTVTMAGMEWKLTCFPNGWCKEG